MKNVFYMHKISPIGGVESYFYYLSKLYDIEVWYTEGDAEQIKRLAQNIPVHKYKEQPIECDRLFSNYSFTASTTAKEKYHVIHYDPLNVGFGTSYCDGWKYIGVSKVACKGFKAITGHDIELIYNVLPIEKPKVNKKEGLHLISCTRLSSEKGGKRINKLANMLDKAGVKYDWTIYTNKTRMAFDSKNITVKPQQLDLRKEVAESSYLVQLSDCESFGLSVCESLMMGTPVIITDLEAFKEIGCKHGINAVVCDMNMQNVDIDMIAKNNMKFTYTPPKSNWDKYLSREKTYNPNELVEVRTLRRFWDIETNIHYPRQATFKVRKSRASYLEALNYVEVL